VHCYQRRTHIACRIFILCRRQQCFIVGRNFMKRLISIVTFILLISLTVKAKVIVIDKQYLQDAKTIRTIIVLPYKDSTMFYRLQNSKDTLSISCRTKQYSEPFRQTLIKNKGMLKTDLAGKWPTVGQKVLIVINKNNRVSLFATKTGDDYRFWDPNSVPFANSIFSIPKERPYKPLENCNDLWRSENVNYWTCTDGCLLIAFDLKERG
jgi:hypothetical protein